MAKNDTRSLTRRHAAGLRELIDCGGVRRLALTCPR
jgi:hypothetical protein